MTTLSPPALDPTAVEARIGTNYPGPLAGPCAERQKRALGDALGLTAFGVNVTRLAPGVWSAHRHWHTREDEFIYVLEGELTLVNDAGEQTLGPGMAAGFPAGAADGHHLVNKSESDAVYLEVGDRKEGDEVNYPDVDLHVRWADGGRAYVHKDGSPY